MAWIVAGGCIGWFTNWAWPRKRRLPTAYSVAVGAVGGFVNGLALTPLLGLDLPGDSPLTLELPALIVAIMGAIVLLAAVNYAHRR